MSDVEITYKLVPDEASLKAVAGKLTSHLNKGFGGSGGGGRNNRKNEEPLIKAMYDLAKIFGKGRTFNTKMASVQDIMKTSLFGEKGYQSRNEKGQFGANIPGTKGLAGSGGKAELGAVTGLLGGILGATMLISVGMFVIAAFFEAVGPFIKVVMKLFAAFFLIALLPALKVLMKSLPTIWAVLKVIATVLSYVLQAIIDSFGSTISSVEDIISGKGTGIDWAKMLLFIFSPMLAIMGPILTPLFVQLINSIGAAIFGDAAWSGFITGIVGFFNGIGKTVGDGLKTAGDGVSGVIDGIKTTVQTRGTEMGTSLDNILDALKSGDFWKVISATIDMIGTSIFGKSTWDTIKSSIVTIVNVFIDAFNALIPAINLVGDAVYKAYNATLGIIFGQATYTKANPITDQMKTEINYAINSALGITASVAAGAFAQAQSSLMGKPQANYGLYGQSFGTDFISRPGGGISFSPQDTIIGVKDPSSLGGGTTINNTYNISGNVDKTQLKQMMNDMAREQGRQLRGKTSYVSGFLA